MTNSDPNVSASYLKNVAKLAANIKQRSYELMNINAGDCVLDVGCGPGVDLPALVERVGDQGKVYALDNDADMLREAKQQAVKYPEVLEFREADVAQVPFTEKAFNAVRAERLFQVLPRHYDQWQVASELSRILKNRGRLVLVDTDWASASVNFSNAELERRLLNFFAVQLRPNGFAGRQLSELAQQAGLQISVQEITPLYSDNLDQSPFADWLPTEAEKAGICSANEAQLWRTELADRARQGRFYSCVNIVSVCAVRMH